MVLASSRLAAVAALVALLATAFGLPGCSNKSCTCPEEIEDIYPSRTSPENVIEKLNLAYVNMDADAYLDCLGDSFTFYVNPDILGNPYDDIPESWNKALEETIHRAMFSESSDVERVRLTLTAESIEWNQGDGLWRYTEAADVRITVAGDLTFYAASPQLFVLAIDEDRAGSAGRELWEIVEWHDLSEYGERSVECANWSSIKLLYR